MRPVFDITKNSFCFNSNLSNLYNNDVIYKIKSRENSVVCEHAPLLFPLQYYNIKKHRSVTDIRSCIYNRIAGVLLYKQIDKAIQGIKNVKKQQ